MGESSHDPRADAFDEVLGEASALAARWLDGVRDGTIPSTATIDQVKDALGRELPARGDPAVPVLRRLADAVEPGLIRMDSPRFYGWVIGGTQPVALGADWLVSSWDQNAAMRAVTPGVVAAEEIAGDWLLELLGLPRTAEVGFVTGATTATTVGLIAGRDEVLRRVGWDARTEGLAGGPRVRFIAGRERHGSADDAGRYAGLGAPTVVASDEQGRIDVTALRDDARRRAAARLSSPCRPATSTPARSTISPPPRRSRTRRARGCTSTAPSGCGPRPRPGSRT